MKLAAELTDEQLALYKEDEDQFWDEFWDWDIEFEFTRDKDGGTDYQLEEYVMCLLNPHLAWTTQEEHNE